jgi:hypothetical protein
MDTNEQKPLETPEALKQWLRENLDCNSPWEYYLVGVAHGENAQHEKSYRHGYKDGWRDGQHPLNKKRNSKPLSLETIRRASAFYGEKTDPLLKATARG